MAINERPSVAQQENLLTILCHKPEGKTVTALARVEMFDGDYRVLAERAFGYWREHDAPPGSAHTGDLVADITEDVNDRRAPTFRRIVAAMRHLAPHLNTDYILSELQIFTRVRLLQDALIRAAGTLQANGGKLSVDQTEAILLDVLHARHLQFDAGTRLDADLSTFFDWLDTRHCEFTTGIRQLDERGVVPYRGAVLLFIAGKGRGKSWFLVNLGRNALLARKKVLHVSLEMDENECRMRYFQTLFAVPRRLDASEDSQRQLNIQALQRQQDGKYIPVPDRVAPEFAFDAREVRLELETRIALLGIKAHNLVIKRFPNRSLTVDMLEAYLDMLEQIDGFLPDLLLLDYAKLLKLNGYSAADRRLGIGDNLERLRALAIRRNIALVTADQLNRPGYNSNHARSAHIGEDWSQVHTADVVLTHSATDSEMGKGLCRIYVDHARAEGDKFELLLTQNFATGQFVLNSCYMRDAVHEPNPAAQATEAYVGSEEAYE